MTSHPDRFMISNNLPHATMLLRIGFLAILLMGFVWGGLSVSLSHAEEKELELLAVGIRGATNLPPLGLPPGEKHDFYAMEGFAVIGFPGAWEWPRGWEGRYRWNVSLGTLTAKSDWGLFSTTGPSVAFTKWDWRLTFDVGTGVAFVSDQKYGKQDFGGPVQIVGHGGFSYHFPGHMVVGWRFHHFSDAGFYGSSNRGVDMHFIELSYHF